MSLIFARPTGDTIPLRLVEKGQCDAVVNGLSTEHQAWVSAQEFKAAAGEVCLLSDGKNVEQVLVGLGDATTQKRQRFILGGVRAKLPRGTYHIEGQLTDTAQDEHLLGWLLSGYQFDKYAKSSAPKSELVAPSGCNAARLEAIAAGEALTRTLINTPASDMGPDELERAVRELATANDASVDVIEGDALLSGNFPMIHTVGRASDRAPRLIDCRWSGTRDGAGPTLTLVGKGVCFDTGGLNIKPGGSMGLMKKDMGGAATVLGLAHMIMASKLPIELRVLIPAVENAISGNAFRPQDILTSRKGLTVEINNTDAEGRLVLADALTLADEDTPDLIVSMATLTGAARVALGPDLAPFYATSEADAAQVEEGARKTSDPVWQMPFWDPYEKMIEPGIADLDNAPKGGMAGSITAALFLRRFVTQTPRYVHFDIYGWNPTAAPARPKGGVGQGARALFDALPALLKFKA